jgi:hypothetical protein
MGFAHSSFVILKLSKDLSLFLLRSSAHRQLSAEEKTKRLVKAIALFRIGRHRRHDLSAPSSPS